MTKKQSMLGRYYVFIIIVCYEKHCKRLIFLLLGPIETYRSKTLADKNNMITTLQKTLNTYRIFSERPFNIVISLKEGTELHLI